MEPISADSARTPDSPERSRPGDEFTSSPEWLAVSRNVLSRGAEHNLPPWAHMRRCLAGLAGVMLVTALLAVLLATSDSPSVQTFIADVGEIKSISLPDGSVVTLNTDSVLRMLTQGRTLHFELLRGEALFAMTRNPERHLLVSVGDLSITEAGTTFSVRIVDEGGVRVIVESGTVGLTSSHTPRTVVYPNQQISQSDRDHPGTLHRANLTSDEVHDRLAWRTGEIVFHCASVADAAQEFSRYNRRVRIEVQGVPDTVRVGGAFVAKDPLAFVQSIAIVYPDVRLQIEERGPDHRILHLTGVPPTPSSHSSQQTAEH